jgi:hypothetical protein
MTRPRRLYQEGGNYYYLEGGAKKKIKVPEGISQKQLQKINIKNIINLAERRRVKRRKKPIKVRFGKKIVSQMEKEPQPEQAQPSLSSYLFKPKLAVKTLDELAQADVDTNIDKLAQKLTSRLQPVVTPPTIPQPAEIPPLPPALPGVSTSAPAPAPAPETPAVNLFAEEGEAPATPQGQVNREERPPPASAPQAGTATPVTRTIAQRAREALGFRQPAVAPAPPAPPAPLAPGRKIALRDRPDDITRIIQQVLIDNPGIQTGTETQNVAFRRAFTNAIPTVFPGQAIDNFQIPNTQTLAPYLDRVRGLSSASSGRGNGENDGLFNDEIEEIARRTIKNYVPVIASDEINTLSKYVKPGQKRFAFIVNTNPSTSDGSGNDNFRPGHWRGIYINNDDSFPSVEYFDPLCEGRIPNDLLKVCMKIARKMNPEMMFKYKQNMLKRQSNLTSNCGYHSLKFIEDRYNGVPWSEATGYDDYMSKLNEAKDDSRDGEKDVMKYIKRYDSYI